MRTGNVLDIEAPEDEVGKGQVKWLFQSQSNSWVQLHGTLPQHKEKNHEHANNQYLYKD